MAGAAAKNTIFLIFQWIILVQVVWRHFFAFAVQQYRWHLQPHPNAAPNRFIFTVRGGAISTEMILAWHWRAIVTYIPIGNGYSCHAIRHLNALTPTDGNFLFAFSWLPGKKYCIREYDSFILISLCAPTLASHHRQHHLDTFHFFIYEILNSAWYSIVFFCSFLPLPVSLSRFHGQCTRNQWYALHDFRIL